MKLSELKELIKHLPDDTDLLVHLGDLEMYEVQRDMILPSVLEHSYAVVLVCGQVCNYEFDIDARIDGYLL